MVGGFNLSRLTCPRNESIAWFRESVAVHFILTLSVTVLASLPVVVCILSTTFVRDFCGFT